MSDPNRPKLAQLMVPIPRQLSDSLKSISQSTGSSVQEIAITALTSYVLNEKRLQREERLRTRTITHRRFVKSTIDDDTSQMSNPDFYQVISRIPDATICLISALSFHEITLQIPHEVQIAIAPETKIPKIDYPPMRVFRMSVSALTPGVETHILDGVPVKIHSASKTVADCFKYRNKIGLDVAVESLRMYLFDLKGNIGELMKFADLLRVEKTMRPYLEAMLS